jgi:hypothetical protein
MAHTTGRYTSSPESQLESDVGRIASLPLGDGAAFIIELDRIIAANFTGDYWEISLPNRLDTSSSRSPALFAYLASLNILDAEVLFSNVRVKDLLDPSTTAPRSVERHHLFPRKHLESLGVSGTRQINAIANMAFLDWPENVKISANAPHDYWARMTEVVDREALAKQIYWHALPVGWEQLDYPVFLERRRQLIARVVRDAFKTLAGERKKYVPTTVDDLIAAGESQTTEFKSSVRWNVHTEQNDPKLGLIIVKAVCGFLNAEGGTLLIGVSDNGDILGIENDFSTLGTKQDTDGYELFLRQLLDDSLSAPTAATVRIRFPHAEGKTVCQVGVAASGRPVFAKPAKGGADATEFWVRVGNATKQLHGDDLVKYQETHWE